MKIDNFENRPLQFVAASAGDLGNDLKKVEGCAYSGGTFSQFWSNVPCVTDIDGLEIAAQIPLMYNHYNDPAYRLGVLTVSKSDGALFVSGGIDPDTERGKAIIEAGKKCEWQLSHAAEIKSAKHIEKDEKVTINGREFTGPLLHITSALLREVSIVAIGADADTGLRIAAGFGNQTAHETKGDPMKDKVCQTPEGKDQVLAAAAEGTTPAATVEQDNSAAVIAAERARVKSVRAALKGYPALQDKAIEAGWSEEYALDIVANIKEATSGCTTAQNNIIVKSKKSVDEKTIEAALSFRAGVSENDILAGFGEEVTDQADKMRGMSLHEALLAACQAKGIATGAVLDHDTIKAGFTATDLPQILSNVAGKRMLQEYNRYDIIAHKLCSVGDLSDYKESIRVGMNDFGSLEIVPVGGTVKEGTIGEESATNKVDRYARTFFLDEALIINDDLGMFLKLPKLFGAKAARLVDQVFFKRLLANPVFRGSALFSTGHKNILTGTSSALSLEALKKLRTLFLKQLDASGEPIAVNPAFLVVPPSLEATAQELLTSTTIITGEAVTRGSANVAGRWGMQVINSPYLENEKYAGNSATGWYLFGDPDQVDTFEVGYLKGRRNPVIERGEFDLSRFGIGYRVSHHFGVREQGTCGMAFANGVN